MSALANDLESLSAAAAPDRAAINLANAQFSTGPKSASGKDAVKFNALKSGLYAQTIVLPGEDQPAFEALGADLSRHFNPATDAERELIATIQNNTWRRKRAVQVEFCLFALAAREHLEAIGEKFSEHTTSVQYALAEAAAYRANLRAFDQLSRQEARMQRAIDRSYLELHALVRARVIVPPPPAPRAPEPVAAQPRPATGFVPPKYPKHMPVFTGPTAKIYRRQWLVKHGFENLT